MAKTFFTIIGLPKLDRKIDRVKKVLGDGKLLTKMALLVERRAKTNATKRPGPRVQTDRLRSSIATQLDSASFKRWARVGTNVEYAPFLEFGTSRMQAYPFLNPALEAVKKKFPDELRRFATTLRTDWGKK